MLTSRDEVLGRPAVLEEVWEKKRGEWGPSQFSDGAAGHEAVEATSKGGGGEDAVRVFSKRVGPIAASATLCD